MTIRILLIDGHEIIRLGMKQILSGTDLVIAEEAMGAVQASEKLQASRFDLIVSDVRVGTEDMMQLLSRVKMEAPQQAVLIFTNADNPTYMARAAAFGSSGYLLKSESPEKIIDTLRRAAAGENTWSREELRKVSGGLSAIKAGVETDLPLTPREGEVLKQLANGLTNKQIAQALGISYETVKEHVQHILRKIGVTDRTQAAVWAVRRNVV